MMQPAGMSLVRMKGLEPIRLTALDPKSSASANSATSAQMNVPIIAYSAFCCQFSGISQNQLNGLSKSPTSHEPMLKPAGASSAVMSTLPTSSPS